MMFFIHRTASVVMTAKPANLICNSMRSTGMRSTGMRSTGINGHAVNEDVLGVELAVSAAAGHLGGRCVDVVDVEHWAASAHSIVA